MKRSTYGFTLVEMAVVLVVIGFLMAGLLGTARTQIEARRVQETQAAMAEIREALVAYTLQYGHLPCPANPALASGSANAGTEDRIVATGLCNRLSGSVPWATLGVRELDAWGRRYTYRVTDHPTNPNVRFARTGTAPCPGQTSAVIFGFCSQQGDINIRPSAGSAAVVAQTVAAVIVSHGADMLGGYNSSGVQLGGASGDQLENANGDAEFVTRTFDDGAGATHFDDLLAWIPANLLVGKLAAAGKLP